MRVLLYYCKVNEIRMAEDEANCCVVLLLCCFDLEVVYSSIMLKKTVLVELSPTWILL